MTKQTSCSLLAVGLAPLLLALSIAPSAAAATVAVMPVQGELTESLRGEVERDLRAALEQRGDTVTPAMDVRRALEPSGVVPADLDRLGDLARRLAVDFVLVAKVTPLPGQYRLELSAFRPAPPGIELLERVILESNASQEIRALLDRLLTQGATNTTAPAPPPSPPEPPEEAGEPPAAEQEEEEAPSAVLPPPQPATLPSRRAYGHRPLEFSLAGGPTALLQEASSGSRAGGRITVGVGYSFYAPLGIGLRADFLSHFGNANAVGVTVGSGIHVAPFRGIPLFVGFRLGLGFLRATGGGQANDFVLRPETVVAYRIGRWVQLELRPAIFALQFGKAHVMQYEALLGVAILLGA